MNNNRDNEREELEKKLGKEYEKNAILNFSQSIGKAIIGHQMSRDKKMIPLKVAILATFLFYRYKFLSRVMDKNMSRLPIR